MNEERVQRRLTTILAADVAGYSRLMGLDEEGTLAALKAHRRALIDPKIAEHRGRVVKTTGDGLLVEFPSVVDAVRCAVEMQRGMALRNESVPADRRLEFRVGVNVGDVIIDEDGDIFGDGVNVAARLEGLAEPGGIVVSRSVRDYVRDKLSFDFEDMGERRVKNIARPVEVHRVRYGGGELSAVVGATHLMAPALRPPQATARKGPMWAGIGAVVLAVAVGGAGYRFLANGPAPVAPPTVAAVPEPVVSTPAAPSPLPPAPSGAPAEVAPAPVAAPMEPVAAPEPAAPVPVDPAPVAAAPAPVPPAPVAVPPPAPAAVPEPPPVLAAPEPLPLRPLSLLPPPAAVAAAPQPPAPVPSLPPVAEPPAPAAGVAAAKALVREAVGGVVAGEETAAHGAASSGIEPVARWGGKLAEKPAETGLCATGQKVEVLWEKEWWPATVRAAAQPDGRCPVRYDGFGREYDESVPPHRLRAKGR
ncbi:MAG TPA: adenylate/guanylate cyclase domain-containing protein [Azospirillum sp.]|nr:adenylate/guanylate cyclase domain-containing protein [Azospirillum sp.]